MSTFYVLPSRHELGECFAAYLRMWFPGIDWADRALPQLAEALGDVAADQPNIYVVYREDLSEEDPARALAEGFGAEAGDDVVEIVTDADRMTARRWRLAA